MTHTRKMSEVVDAAYTLLVNNKTSLQLVDVYYGDQNLKPRTPSACVYAGPLQREWKGNPLVAMNEFQFYVVVYHGAIQDIQINYKQSLLRAEAVEDLFHNNTTLGGLVLFTLAVSNQPGQMPVANSLMAAHQIIFNSTTKTRLT